MSGSTGYTPAARVAGRPGSGGVAHRTPVDLPTNRARTLPLGLASALVLLLAWVLVAPRTPDLAAAAYRVDLFEHVGLAVYDEHWYAGHALPGYSVLFGPLAWLLGLRVVGGMSVLVSVVCFEGLTRARGWATARWATVAFAAAAVGDVWIGRLAFALGVSFALAATLAFARARPVVAAAVAVLSAAASPVAGVLLALAALTHALWRRSPRALLALAAPAAVVVLTLAALFPEGGWEPYPIVSFAATALVVAAFAWALPARAGELRLGAAVYLLACVVLVAVRTPMGSNVERYGVLLAGPLLLWARASRTSASAALDAAALDVAALDGAALDGAALDGAASDRAPLDGPPLDGPGGRVRAFGAARGARLGGTMGAGSVAAAVIALSGWAAWAGWGPARETLAVAGNASTQSSYYAPLERFLDRRAGTPVRVEVPLTRSHWETAELAPRVSLARGWEKQLDTRYDAVLLSGQLTAAGYARWLREQAVSYVALPDTKLDPSSAREGALIRGGLSYLHEVFASRHWRIYAVADATPIATGPGRLASLGHESFALWASERGSFVVRVRYTRYWAVTRGSGCVGRAPNGWTRVLARAPGELTVRASFSLARALGDVDSCPAR